MKSLPFYLSLSNLFISPVAVGMFQCRSRISVVIVSICMYMKHWCGNQWNGCRVLLPALGAGSPILPPHIPFDSRCHLAVANDTWHLSIFCPLPCACARWGLCIKMRQESRPIDDLIFGRKVVPADRVSFYFYENFTSFCCFFSNCKTHELPTSSIVSAQTSAGNGEYSLAD